MPKIDTREFASVVKRFTELSEKMPERKKEFYDIAADKLKEMVDAEIIASGINDEHNHVRNWQIKAVGSQGGYAAIRPIKDGKKTGKNSPGAITGYLERGHNIRRPSGENKYYRYRAKTLFVKGYHFYENAKNKTENEMLKLAEEFANEIAAALGGE